MKVVNIGTVLTDGTNNYKIEEFKGDGGFADVYKASCEGKYYAIKVLKDFSSKNEFSFKNEFDVASKVSSEHAIKYYYYNENGKNDYPCFIIMEYAEDGNLAENIKSLQSMGTFYSTEKLFEIFMQLIDGMIEISKVAVHRDIKPHNILISNGIYKISDYGISKYVNETTRSVSKTFKGWHTNLYYAPELWANPTAQNLNTPQVDIYAMGIVFYQIANLTYPYEDTTDCKKMHMTAPIKSFNGNVDVVFQNLISKMMAKSTTERFDNWEQIKDFLSNSNLGMGGKRDPFVDSLLKNSALNQQGIEAKKAKKDKEETERIETFRRLVSQIESSIYLPLRHIVDEFNSNATSGKMSLSQMEVNDEDEEFSFKHTVEPMSEDEEERTISFNFMAMHSETKNPLRSIPTQMYFDEYDDRNELLNNIVNPSPKTIEYKYFKDKILLWGVIQADCGIGINIAVLNTPADSLYGVIKAFLRVPNYEGYNYWFPIKTKSELKRLCPYFHDYKHHIKVEDYDFNIIKMIISQNGTFDIDSIKDPTEDSLRFFKDPSIIYF